MIRTFERDLVRPGRKPIKVVLRRHRAVPVRPELLNFNPHRKRVAPRPRLSLGRRLPLAA